MCNDLSRLQIDLSTSKYLNVHKSLYMLYLRGKIFWDQIETDSDN